jgi:hypothetical protein
MPSSVAGHMNRLDSTLPNSNFLVRWKREICSFYKWLVVLANYHLNLGVNFLNQLVELLGSPCVIPMLMGVKNMWDNVQWEICIQVIYYNCWVGRINQNQTFFCCTLDDVGVVVLKKGEGDDFIVLFQCDHLMYINIIWDELLVV